MVRAIDNVLPLRTTPDVKVLLKRATEKEERSVASMVEIVLLDYARGHSSTLSGSKADIVVE